MWRDIDINYSLLADSIYILDEFIHHCTLVRKILHKAKNGKLLSSKKIVIQHKTQPLTEEELNKELVAYMEYLTQKIFTKYNHEPIRKKLVKHIDLIDKNLEALINDSEELAAIMVNIDKTLRENPPYKLTKNVVFDNVETYDHGVNFNVVLHMLYTMYQKASLLDIKALYFFMTWMDIYFLRRFLDKDYITNAIVYTGGWHSELYVSTLVKDFGFKVTHASYSKISDMEKLNDEIMNRKPLELSELFFPVIENQCSDLTDFPENFL
jgi:hypothetical protein